MTQNTKFVLPPNPKALRDSLENPFETDCQGCCQVIQSQKATETEANRLGK